MHRSRKHVSWLGLGSEIFFDPHTSPISVSQALMSFSTELISRNRNRRDPLSTVPTLLYQSPHFPSERSTRQCRNTLATPFPIRELQVEVHTSREEHSDYPVSLFEVGPDVELDKESITIWRMAHKLLLRGSTLRRSVRRHSSSHPASP